jgi:hypothetical protein
MGSALAAVVLASGAWAQGVPPTVPPWMDGFESYALGSDPTQPSQGGWENWDLAPATGAVISNAFVLNGSQAFKNGGDSDAVQKFTGTAGGLWTNVANIYIPSSGTHQVTVETWYIVLNTFNHGAAAPKLWSLQLGFEPATGNVRYLGGPNGSLQFPYASDVWMTISTDLDFTQPPGSANAQTYLDLDGPGPNPPMALGPAFDWSEGASTAGIDEFQAIDLWSNVQSLGANPNGGAFYDDLSLKPQGTPTTSFCTAKTNVCGTPTMSASGVASATAGSGFTVSASPARSNRSGIFMYNTALAAGPLPFEGGTLCVEPMGLRRAGSTNSGGTCAPVDCTGVLSIDMNAFAVGAWVVPLPCGGSPIPPNNPAGYLTTPGTQVFGQFWARFSPGNSLVSDGIGWTIGP